uniref:Gustatory receptor n=1 Tax=Lutzomyia longipalpis TaxID=7200 RepID=A0A7G3A7I6_LUTLO
MNFYFEPRIRDIYDVIYPFYILSKILGFTTRPLRPQKNQREFLKHFIPNLFYYFLLISIESYLISKFIIAYNVHTNVPDTPIGSFSNRIIMPMSIISYFVMQGVTFCLQKHIQKFVPKIAKTDELMEAINIHQNYQFHFKFIFFYVIAIILQALAVSMASFLLQNYHGIYFNIETIICSTLVASISNTTFVSHMLLTTIAIYIRFKALNRFVKHTFISHVKIRGEIGNDFASNIINGVHEEIRLIRKVSTIYDRLSGITSHMNVCFSFQIMMNMISWFIYTIYGTFNFYRLILINFKGYELLGYANMMWIVYHAMYLSAVVIFSSLIKAEGKKTSILLHQAINLEWNSKIVREMRIFSQQLGHRQPIVTCGLFPFDWSLFYSVSQFSGRESN